MFNLQITNHLLKKQKKLNKKHCSHDAYKQWEQSFYLIFFTIILVLYIFYACGSLRIIEKIYNNTKIMVKKLNKKHCSHDAYKQWEQCFLFNF